MKYMTTCRPSSHADSSSSKEFHQSRHISLSIQPYAHIKQTKVIQSVSEIVKRFKNKK